VNQPSETGSDSRHSTPTLLAIYRELRIAMVVVMVMLAAAVLLERRSATRFQSALSEYYYTSAHSIFIAALLALSTLFFVYKGRNDTEDALLTLAGVCTFTAALVPQGWPVEVWGSKELKDYNPGPAIQPNFTAIVIALVLGWSLMLLQHRHRYNHAKQRKSLGGRLALHFLRLVVVVGLIAMVLFQPLFIKHAHGAAGTLMIFSFVATVFCTAYVVGKQGKGRFHAFYRGTALLMLVTLIGVVTLHLVLADSWRLWIIWLESALILEFAAYWVVQTIELWDDPDPREQLPGGAQRRLGEGQTNRSLRERLKDELDQAKKELAQAREEKSLLPLL
jgi:hypothetical protein